MIILLMVEIIVRAFLLCGETDDRLIKEDLARLMFHLSPIDQCETHAFLTLIEEIASSKQHTVNGKRVEYLKSVWVKGWIEKKGPWKFVQRAPRIWDHSSWLVFLEEFFYQCPIM